MTLNLLPTPEAEPARLQAVPGGEPLLTVQLPLGAWHQVLRQLGDGSINRFLPLLTRIDQQLSRQLANGADE
jgi:hypothetical protein